LAFYIFTKHEELCNRFSKNKVETWHYEERKGGVKIAIGADHGGYKLKSKLIKFLEARGYGVADLGTHGPDACDYPAVGYKVAASVSGG